MKKLPTLFERVFEEHKLVGITDKVTPGMEWVLAGEGDATIKYDGACCAIIDGVLYKRYDAKRGKTPPPGAVPCCEPDPVTGHWPHWVRVDHDNPADKWFSQLCSIHDVRRFGDGTYEAVGPHFQNNPYDLRYDILIPHGQDIVLVDRTFDGIREYLRLADDEGLVFWKDDEPQCKIKRRDFGFKWPIWMRE